MHEMKILGQTSVLIDFEAPEPNPNGRLRTLFVAWTSASKFHEFANIGQFDISEPLHPTFSKSKSDLAQEKSQSLKNAVRKSHRHPHVTLAWSHQAMPPT